MGEFVKIAKLSELSIGERKVVRVGDRTIALFNIGDAIHAIDNVCPHRGGPLAEGPLKGTVISCPLHHWAFDITTGQSPYVPDAEVERFETRIEGDDILVCV